LSKVLAAATAIAAAAWAGSALHSVKAQDNPGTAAFYTEKVKPILTTNCGKCHFDMNHKGGLSLATRAAALKGGRDGVVIVPGDPDNSLLVKLINHNGPPDDPKPMPPKAPKIDDADIAVITAWIKAGAVMPPDPPTPAQ
jgi:cytochrome c553